ncbi:MAG: hypothetical protein NW207_03495 [Cytophagales bacterium]|nr:hypothetical protein [Cytophagales bacterium]
MKKTFALLFVAGVLAFASCQKKAEESTEAATAPTEAAAVDTTSAMATDSAATGTDTTAAAAPAEAK